MKINKEDLRILIGEDHLEVTLKILLQIIYNNETYRDTIFILLNKFKGYKQERLRGITDYDTLSIKKNDIVHHVLDLINDMPGNEYLVDIPTDFNKTNRSEINSIEHVINYFSSLPLKDFKASNETLSEGRESESGTNVINNPTTSLEQLKRESEKWEKEKRNFNHCFRPIFTRNIILSYLDKGNSINVYCEKAKGKTRLLHDIQRTCKYDTRVLVSNMHQHLGNYSSFIKDLCTQLKLEPVKENIQEVFDHITKKGQKTFLLLDNFDTLQNTIEIDNKYDRSFLDSLNTIQKNPNLSLLCVTEKLLTVNKMYYNNVYNGTSFLSVAPILMTDPTDELVIVEIERKINLKEEQLSPYIRYFVKEVMEHKFLYDFLEQTLDFVSNLESPNEKQLIYELRVKNWLKRYKRNSAKPKGHKISKVLNNIDFFLRNWGLKK